MWISIECDTDWQILPEGEETYHDWDSSCECCPRVTLDDMGKMVVTHSAFDQREILDRAYYTPLHTVRQEVDC